jgi:bifunctional DNase/RNase
VPGDFDKLFGDDWQPPEFDPEGGRLPSFGASEEKASFPVEGGTPSEQEYRAPRSLNEKEVKVMGVFMHQAEAAQQHFVLLRDNRGRRVPIWVGQFEAWAITLALEGEAPDRPFTHDLIKILLDRLDASVERIVIDDLWNETFYAKLTLARKNGETSEIDARPSDAIAIALRSKAPIYMAENVLEATVHQE